MLIRKLLTLTLLLLTGASLTTCVAQAVLLRLSNCHQSSLAVNGVCSRAIDGNTDQNLNAGSSCTHTNHEMSWWTARTERLAHVKEVKIFNRQDCCPERLRNFAITVDGIECASFDSAVPFSVRTFVCDKVGQHLMIKSRVETPLTLCEVQVFGEYIEPASGALLKLNGCSQSSLAVNGVCSRAIDGNTDQNLNAGSSCTHTNHEMSWWTASTERLAHVREVRIFNRLDCCPDRLSNFLVEVDGKECGSYNSDGVFSMVAFKCDRVGQQITVRSRKATPLTLCEVQVFGEFAIERPKFKLEGCYLDSIESRDLPSLVGTNLMTPKKCNSLCVKRGTAYFALQAGTQCWCGDNFGSSGSGSEAECKMACTGDSGDTCGGELRNAVFQVDKSQA